MPLLPGQPLNPLARNVTIKDLSISDLCHLPIEQALAFHRKAPSEQARTKLLDEVQKQLLNRLSFLCEVGLHYIVP